MVLSDYGILFSGGLAVGMILMSASHLVGICIKLFANMLKGGF